MLKRRKSKLNRGAKKETQALVNALREKVKPTVICLSHSWGGLEQVAANDTEDLVEVGLPVQLLCLKGSPIHERLIKKNLPAIPISFQPRNFFDFKMKSELRQLLSKGTNLIHTHQTSLLGSIVPWVYGEPHVVLIASRHILNQHNKKNLFHAAIYRRLDALVVMSETLRDNVLQTHAISSRRVETIRLGLDFDQFDPKQVDSTRQRKVWGADEKTVVIGIVGRIDPAKGQETFLKAAAGLLENPVTPHKLKFVVVGEETLGSTSDYLGELQEVVHQFRMEKQVIFAGYQENIPEIMHALDIFVMPSLQETFGLVAIEAMAMECPIVISSGGSSQEIVGQKEFGLLMRPNDPFDLKNQLLTLIESPEKRLKMGTAARDHVKKNYSKEARIRSTLDLYERCFLRRST